MILFIHNNNQVCKVLNTRTNTAIVSSTKRINTLFFELAERFSAERIVWCHQNLVDFINFKEIEMFSDVSVKMASYETSNTNFIDPSIGFIEQSPFVNVAKEVIYPTWLMSSDVGVIHASVIEKFKSLQKNNFSFIELLNYIAKKGMYKGLLCYSNPKLLNVGYTSVYKKSISKSSLLQFIKSNYKYRWVWLYIFNQFIYNKKLLFIAYLKSILKPTVVYEVEIPLVPVNNKLANKTAIDVILPTLGREKYLKDVLIDLSKQTLLPIKIIIVEQQSEEGLPSTLEFLDYNWPFEIDHTLIYELGACNARNIALQKVESEWTFFADDDVRLNADFLEKSFKYIHTFNAKAVTLSCLQKGESEKTERILQWSSFGSGCSIIKSNFLKYVKFNMALEFGYGEDVDYGMQLRKKGIDVLYIPFVKMVHLKAPIGGFRKKKLKRWEKDIIQPKPSPTIMVTKLKHSTKEQLNGYKTSLFIKYYKKQAIKNPIQYYYYMKNVWAKSIFWANNLIQENEV